MNKLLSQFLLLVLGMICVPTARGEHECKSAKVQWVDATLHSRPHNPDFSDFTSLLTYQTAFGCVEIQGDAVLIVFNFVDGEPDTFLVLPKVWATKITYLKEEEAPPEKKHEETPNLPKM